MKKFEGGHYGTADDSELLTHGLTSKVPAARCMTRGIAAVGSEIGAWLNDEINNRKTDPSDVLLALARLQAQTFASAAAHLLAPDGIQHAVRLYVELAQEQIPHLAGIIHKEDR